MTPACSARVTRRTRPTSRVHNDPDKPYALSLASAMASDSSLKERSAATGPKISSCAIFIFGPTPENTAGVR